MPLKAIKPDIVKATKPKFMISGRSGIGKTSFALNFPRPYLIDTEGGATREQYMKKLIANEGGYFGKEQGSQDFKLVIEEIKELATSAHGYKTLIIDSFTKLYNMTAAIAEEEVGSDYGKDKKEANRPTRQLMRWLEKIDMTCILICHSKDKWERKGKEIVYSGTTFEGYDKLEYDLDLWIEIIKTGKQRDWIVKKSRVANFIEGEQATLDYKRFCELYGTDVIESDVSRLVMATQDQVDQLDNLLKVVHLDKEVIDKWLKKAGAENFSEMSFEQISKCISAVKGKYEEITKSKKAEAA